jgi:hypothetical protein
MDDIPRTMQAIRAFLDGSQQFDEEELNELAREYTETCAALNRKLGRCRELLQAGKRSKAMHLARQLPDLQETLSVMELEEADAWLNICESLGVAVQSPFQAELAQGLVAELYADTSEMDELLRAYRRLSLSRSPMADRLRVLRKLHKADPDSWIEDVQKFETARLEQLARTAERGVKVGDLATLERALAELKSGEWVNRPRSKFVKAVELRTMPHRQRAANEEYRALLEKAREAHAAMNEAVCRQVAGEWESVRDRTEISPETALAEQFAPVEGWLQELSREKDEQRAFETACHELEQAIEEKEDLHRLEKLMADVFRFERGMPDLLAARANSRMSELRQASRRRFVATLVSIILVVCLVGAGVAVAVTWYTESQQVQRWEQKIAGAIDTGQLQAAGELIDQVQSSNPDVYASPEIQDLRNRHNDLVTKEKEREQAFSAAMAAVEEAGVETPNGSALKRADQLAHGLEEKSLVQDWREKISRHAAERQKAREAEIDRLIESLEDRHEQLADAKRFDTGNIESLSRSSLELSEKIKAAEGITSLQEAKVEALEESVIQLRAEARKNAARRKAIQDALANVRKNASQPENVTKELKAFASEHPSHPLAAQFIKAGRLAPTWKALAAWSRLRGEWGSLSVGDVKEAKARSVDVSAYLEEHKGTAQAEAVKQYSDYLDAAVRALSGSDLRHAGSLKELLTENMIADVLLVEVGEKRFYTMQESLDEGTINGKVIEYRFEYIADTRGTTKQQSVDPCDLTSKPVPAPQTAFSKKSLAALTKFKGPGWETLYLKLAGDIVSNEKIDPVLQAALLKKILGYALDISPIRRLPKVEEAAISLQKVYYPVDWMDPYDKKAQRLRLQLEKLMKTMQANLKAAPATVASKIADMSESLRSYHPAGILLASDGSFSRMMLPQNGGLYAPIRSDDGQTAMKRIGEVSAGKPSLDAEAVTDLPRGSMIFAVSE